MKYTLDQGEFPKNDYRHHMFTIVGRSITGKQEIARMLKQGFRVSDYAKQILTSTNTDSYDANHRLEDGKDYRIVLIPRCEIQGSSTTTNICEYARKFGYGALPGGTMPCVREVVSDHQMKHMNIGYIVSFCEPIKDVFGVPRVLYTSRYCDGGLLSAPWVHPDDQWDGAGAFAFLIHES